MQIRYEVVELSQISWIAGDPTCDCFLRHSGPSDASAARSTFSTKTSSVQESQHCGGGTNKGEFMMLQTKNRKIIGLVPAIQIALLENRDHHRTQNCRTKRPAQQKRENGQTRKKENEKQQEKTQEKEKSTKARNKHEKVKQFQNIFPVLNFMSPVVAVALAFVWYYKALATGTSAFPSKWPQRLGKTWQWQRWWEQEEQQLLLIQGLRLRLTTAPGVATTERCRAKEAVMKRRRRRGRWVVTVHVSTLSRS